MALVGIAAFASLSIGLVLYYFAESRLVKAEGDLLTQRSRTANVRAGDFLEGLRNPEDRTLPAPDTYAEELVKSVSDSTGLGVLYIGPDGEPLAARDGLQNSVAPEVAYQRLGMSRETVQRVLESPQLEGRLIPRDEGPHYVAVWPIAGADGVTRGVMVYTSPQDEFAQVLAYLRYGILGAIGASVLLAAAGSLLLTRRITRPLSETRDAAIRVASGDYRTMPVESQDELGEVARSFNYMAEEIERYIGEIQEQKSRLEAVLAASPEAIVATDPEGRMTMANPAAVRMLGIRVADYGRKLEEIWVPEGVLQCVRQASTTGVAVREVELGEKTYWAYAAQVNRQSATADGSSRAGIILEVRDITEHRSLERAKTAFVSDLSHELRTPLTTIQSAVHLLERAQERLDPLEHRALELAEGELRRIRGMVEELLTLAQMDSWQYSLKVETVDLSGIIHDSVDAVLPKAERFGIEIHFEDGEEHRCACDAEKLYQVFLNLLDNAVKYSDPGARVDVLVEEDAEFVTVEVRDTGVGIPEEDLNNLFERFYRVDKDRSRATGGSGLGLAIAKEIVELHGGEIHVESEVGAGSMFSVRLPRTPLSRSTNYAI